MKRMNWFDKLIVAAILILLAVILSPKKAQGEEPKAVYTFKEKAAEIVFLDAPCTQPWVKGFVAAMQPELLPRLKRAIGRFYYNPPVSKWKLQEGCWIEFTAEETGVPTIGHIWDDQTRYLEPKEKFTGGPSV